MNYNNVLAYLKVYFDCLDPKFSIIFYHNKLFDLAECGRELRSKDINLTYSIILNL